jgi:hypothetical protein
MEQTARQKTPTFLTLEELSRRMGMSTAWVYKYAARLGGVKIGGTWVFTAINVSKALESAESILVDPAIRSTPSRRKKKTPSLCSLHKRKPYERIHLVQEC